MKYTIILMVILFCLTVSAIEVGQNFTQEQVDNINFDSFNLNATWSRQGNDRLAIEVEPIKKDFKIKFPFTMWSLEQISGEDLLQNKVYTLTLLTYKPHFLYNKWKKCVRLFDQTTCINEFTQEIIRQKSRYVLANRHYLKSLQTKTDPTEEWNNLFDMT